MNTYIICARTLTFRMSCLIQCTYMPACKSQTCNSNSFIFNRSCDSLRLEQNLKKVKLPKTLKEVQGHVFDGCDELDDVKLPSGLEGISDYMFNGCGNLRNINVPSSVVKLGNRAFNGCGKLVPPQIKSNDTKAVVAFIRSRDRDAEVVKECWKKMGGSVAR